MQNPFLFGKPVSGNYFINRKKELVEYQKLLNSKINLILSSRRQVGKTSLLLKLKYLMERKGHIVVYLDLFLVKGVEEFLEYFMAQMISAARSKINKFAEWLVSTIKSIRPLFSFDERGNISASIGTVVSARQRDSLIQEILDIPGRMGEKDKKRAKQVIVILDEFQRIHDIGGIDLESKMRAIMQHHNNVNYIFAGSNRTLLYEAFNNQKRPFFEWGVQRLLGPLERGGFVEYITSEFMKKRIDFDDNVIQDIFDICDDVPNHVQMFCFTLWNIQDDGAKITRQKIKDTVNEIMDNNNHYYENIITGLSEMQVRLLKGISKMGGEGITRSEFLNSNRLNSSANSINCAKTLMSKNILEKGANIYFVRDPFFKLWLRRIP